MPFPMPLLTLHPPSLIHPSLRAGLALRAALREVVEADGDVTPSSAVSPLRRWRLHLWQGEIPGSPSSGTEDSTDAATNAADGAADYVANDGANRVAVLYFHRFRMPSGFLKALRRFTSAGGNLLALHSATASFQRHPEWAEFLGARFTGHDPVETFQVESAPPGILQGLPPFSLRDEVYRLDLAADARVEGMARTASGLFPIAYSRPLGRGRLFYFGAGHRAASWKAAGSRQVLRQALTWLTEPR